MRGFKIAITFCIIAGVFIFDKAGAFSISPIKTQISVAPGAKGQLVAISVRNDETEQKTYSIKVLGAKQMPGGQLTYGVNYSQAESWVVPEKTSLVVGAGQEEKVNFIINVPVTATAGSYFLGLAAESVSGAGAEILGVSGQLVSVFLLQVAGVVNESLTIDDLSLPIISVSGKVPFAVAVKNLGTTELPLKGEIIVRNWLGREVHKETINLGSILLPGSGRKFSAEVLLPGKFILPGPHDFEFKINYGLTGQTVVQARHIWLIPAYSIIALVGLLIIAIVVGVKRKKYEDR
jgi:hypothetical protein